MDPSRKTSAMIFLAGAMFATPVVIHAVQNSDNQAEFRFLRALGQADPSNPLTYLSSGTSIFLGLTVMLAGVAFLRGTLPKPSHPEPPESGPCDPSPRSPSPIGGLSLRVQELKAAAIEAANRGEISRDLPQDSVAKPLKVPEKISCDRGLSKAPPLMPN